MAEFGAKIKYREGRNNIRADTLSRLRRDDNVAESEETPDPQVDQFLQVSAFIQEIHAELELESSLGQDIAEISMEGDPPIPWEIDKLEKGHVLREQQEMPEYQQGIEETSDYVLIDGLLYSLRAPAGCIEYPRLVLPPSTRAHVINRAHSEVGHQGMRKTLQRIHENYK